MEIVHFCRCQVFHVFHLSMCFPLLLSHNSRAKSSCYYFSFFKFLRGKKKVSKGKGRGQQNMPPKCLFSIKNIIKIYEKLLFSVQCRRERKMVIKWKTFSNSRSSFFFLDILSGAETQTFFILFFLFKKEEHNNKQQQKLGKI